MRGIRGIKPVASQSPEPKCEVTVSSRGTKEYLCGERRAKLGGAMSRPEDVPRILKERIRSSGPLSILPPKRRIEAETQVHPADSVTHYLTKFKDPVEKLSDTPFSSPAKEATQKTPDTLHFEDSEEAKERKLNLGGNIVKSMSYLRTFGDRVLNRSMSLKRALDKVPWWMQDDLLAYVRKEHHRRGRRR